MAYVTFFGGAGKLPSFSEQSWRQALKTHAGRALVAHHSRSDRRAGRRRSQNARRKMAGASERPKGEEPPPFNDPIPFT
jgi:hypothetical protein